MTVDQIVAVLARRHCIADMHPDDVEHWRAVVYTVLTCIGAELPLKVHTSTGQCEA